MGEMTLVCPGCGMEYRLPEDAIPAGGREVECTACGHVWQAHPPSAKAPPMPLRPVSAGAPPSPTVPSGDESAQPVPDDDSVVGMPTDRAGPDAALSRKLPDSVLDILRDEVEHERRLRAARRQTSDPADAARPDLESDWPATTVTLPEDDTPHIAAAPQIRPELQRTEPASGRLHMPDPAPLAARPVATAQTSSPLPARGTGPITKPAGVIAPAHRAQGYHGSPLVKPRSRGRYWAGFGLAVMIAAIAATLYLLAPKLQGTGAVGDGLMRYRAGVDQLRVQISHGLEQIPQLFR